MKDIEGWEGYYSITEEGQVLSHDRVVPVEGRPNGMKVKGRQLKLMKHHSEQYFLVKLSEHNKGEHHAVHRLVAQAFIPNPLNLPLVSHKDGDYSNNSVSNLYWTNNQEVKSKWFETNKATIVGERNGSSKYSNQIREYIILSGKSNKDLNKELGIPKSTLIKIKKNGIRW